MCVLCVMKKMTREQLFDLMRQKFSPNEVVQTAMAVFELGYMEACRRAKTGELDPQSLEGTPASEAGADPNIVGTMTMFSAIVTEIVRGGLLINGGHPSVKALDLETGEEHEGEGLPGDVGPTFMAQNAAIAGNLFVAFVMSKFILDAEEGGDKLPLEVFDEVAGQLRGYVEGMTTGDPDETEREAADRWREAVVAVIRTQMAEEGLGETVSDEQAADAVEKLLRSLGEEA